MKRIILIGIIIIIYSMIKPYNELNNIIIVDNIEIECTDKIKIKIKEIIPKKSDNKIEYDYKYYQKEGNSMKQILKEIEQEENKIIYLNHHKLKCNQK